MSTYQLRPCVWAAKCEGTRPGPALSESAAVYLSKMDEALALEPFNKSRLSALRAKLRSAIKADDGYRIYYFIAEYAQAVKGEYSSAMRYHAQEPKP